MSDDESHAASDDESQVTAGAGGDGDVAEELDWDKELALQAEAVELEEKFDLISEDVRLAFVDALKKQSLTGRIFLYKLLDAVDWADNTCVDCLNILGRVPHEMYTHFTQILDSFEPHIMALTIDLFAKTNDTVIMEILTTLPLDELRKLMQIVRHGDEVDKVKVRELCESLTIQQSIHIIDHCNEPQADKCRLCRTKRLNEMEFRMNNKQIPEGTKLLTGLVETYHQPEVWRAPDESEYTFDLDNRICYWRMNVVDTIRICSPCIVEVHAALASDTRFDDMYSFDASGRKEVLKGLRDREQGRAAMIYDLDVERIRRRGRDYALAALEKQRHGLTQERLAREAVELKVLRDAEKADKKRRTEEMYSDAQSVDGKWVQQEAVNSKMVLDRRVTKAELNYVHMYGPGNNVSTEREHPHSWELKQVSEEGVPITAQRSLHRFHGVADGVDPPAPNPQQEKLLDWGEKGEEGHQAYLERMAEEARLRRKAAMQKHRETVTYVDDRLRVLDRARELRERELERMEQLRIEQRAADRLIRRAARIAEMEAAERVLMSVEDDSSWHFRLKRHNALIIAREFEGMRRAEIAQTRIDDFWGIISAEARAAAEKLKKEREYMADVQKMHGLCLQAGIVAPTEAEEEALALERHKLVFGHDVPMVPKKPKHA